MPRLPLLSVFLLAAACSQAQPDQGHQSHKEMKAAEGDSRHHDKAAAGAIVGLRQMRSLKGVVPESSGLAPADKTNTFYTFGDDGNSPTLYKITGNGTLVSTIELNTTNIDWESLSRDPDGNYFLGDCGNNNSSRTDLRILRFRPEQPKDVGVISFRYPGQTEFPPAKKKDRDFDCEATCWHDGLIWLFTKDRARGQASKVYTVPDKPGNYTATYVTTINIPGEVTDAAISPSGRRLVLLGRSELFILDGITWDKLLQDTPQRVYLTGIGQSEGFAFKDERNVLISTEQGGLYEYVLP